MVDGEYAPANQSSSGLLDYLQSLSRDDVETLVLLHLSLNKKLSYAELAPRLQVSIETVKKMENRVLDGWDRCINQDGIVADPLILQAEALNDVWGAAVPATAVHQRYRRLLSRNHYAILDTGLLRDLAVVYLAGPYQRFLNDWLIKEDVCECTDRILGMVVSASGVAFSDVTERVSSECGIHSDYVAGWLEAQTKYKVLNGVFYLWDGRAADRVVMVLGVTNKPATSTEICDWFKGQLSSQLVMDSIQLDSRIVKLQDDRFGLRKWHLQKTSSARPMPQLSPATIDLGAIKHCYSKGDDIGYGIVVNQELLRGFNPRIPMRLAHHLGATRVGDVLSFKSDFGPIVLRKTMSHEDLTSLRSVAIRFKAQLGDTILVWFRPQRRIHFELIAKDDMAHVEPIDRLMIAMGQRGGSVHDAMSVIASALGLSSDSSRHQIEQRLRSRGEWELANLVVSVFKDNSTQSVSNQKNKAAEIDGNDDSDDAFLQLLADLRGGRREQPL